MASVPLTTMVYAPVTGEDSAPSKLVSPPSASFATCVRTQLRTTRKPPSSTWMPEPGQNFTKAPSSSVRVRPAGTRTWSRTTCTVASSQVSSDSSTPPWTIAVPLSTSRLAEWDAPPSPSVKSRHPSGWSVES